MPVGHKSGIIERNILFIDFSSNEVFRNRFQFAIFKVNR